MRRLTNSITSWPRSPIDPIFAVDTRAVVRKIRASNFSVFRLIGIVRLHALIRFRHFDPVLKAPGGIPAGEIGRR